LPYSLARESRRHHASRFDTGLNIGSYGFDRSDVYLNSEDESVYVFTGGTGDRIARWRSPLAWLTDEIARLKLLFDSEGKCLTSRAETVPAPQRQVQ